MKRFFAVVAVLGILGFAGCDDGNGEKKGDKDLTGNITISPTTAFTGEELTANYSGNEKVNYQWNKDGTAIGGKTDQKITPTEAGGYTVTVRLTGYKGKTSTAVTVTAIIDLTGNITITSATALTGVELTANYSGSEAVNYQWNKDGTALDGKTAQKFTTTEAGSYTVTVSLAGYKSKTSTAITLKREEQLYPLEGVLTLEGTGSVDVNITYMAVSELPLPDYMTILEKVIKDRLLGLAVKDITLTINVTVDPEDENDIYEGFVLTGSKTLSVLESWISNDTRTENEISQAMRAVRVAWIAMMESNNAIRMANFRVTDTFLKIT
jgi:hypothetical protein